MPQPSQPQHNAAVPLDRVYSLERGEWRSGVRQGEVIIANCSCAMKRKERESGGQEVTGKHKKYEKSGDKGKHEASVSTYKELYYSALLRQTMYAPLYKLQVSSHVHFIIFLLKALSCNSSMAVASHHMYTHLQYIIV